MATRPRWLLAVGFPASELVRYRPVLEVGSTVLATTSDGAEALHEVQSTPLACVVVRLPVHGVELADLVEAVRAPGGVNQAAGVVVLAAPEDMAAAEALKGHGVNKVVSTADGPEILGCVVMRLESVDSRHAERVPARLRVEWEHGGVTETGRTVNISLRGMLVETGTQPRRGAALSFRLYPPGGDTTITGEARVVRTATAEREPFNGFAVRFLTFYGDGKVRLESLLEGMQPAPSEPAFR